MKTAIVFIETKSDQLKKSSLEILSALQGSDYEISTCGMGAVNEQVLEHLGLWGVYKHFLCRDEILDVYNPETWQQFFTLVFKKIQPQLFMANSNSIGRDVFPRLAAEFETAYMSDVTEISFSPGLLVKRPMYSGKCSAQVTFTDESPKIILLRSNQIPVIKPTGNHKTEVVEINLDNSSGNSQTLCVKKGESEKLDLTEADIIVSGGRGLKEADNFRLLHELAKSLGATVGASRAVVDMEWVPHSMQVGQTGKTVTPSLYFAIGISGAIQHLAGMSGSKNIVAINKDEKAPIFQKATYGLVGDLFELVPLLTEKLKKLQN